MSCTTALVLAGDGRERAIAGACEVLARVLGSISPQGWPQQPFLQASNEARNLPCGWAIGDVGCTSAPGDYLERH